MKYQFLKHCFNFFREVYCSFILTVSNLVYTFTYAQKKKFKINRENTSYSLTYKNQFDPKTNVRYHTVSVVYFQ